MPQEVTMEDASGMTERERIAYRLGFDDGLAALREKIKDLLLENNRLRTPILDRPDRSAAGRDLADLRLFCVFGSSRNGHAVRSGDGRGQL